MATKKGFAIGVGIAACYLLTALAALSLNFQGTNISPVWPPSGLAVAALLLFGPRYWPGVTLGAFIANYATGLSFPVASAISIGNTLEAVFATLLIRRFASHRNPLNNVHDLMIFFGASLSGSSISATLGTAAVYLGGFSHGAPPGYLWRTWWWGDTVGALVFAPVILAFSERTAARLLRSWLYFGLVQAAVMGIGLLAFSPVMKAGPQVLYGTVPLIILAAYLFQQKGASTAVCLLSLTAIIGTIHGNGPFLMDSLNESLLLLQTFIGVVSATALVVGAVTRENSELYRTTQVQLQEKEVLLSEIHHRVKNNLQVVSSLMDLQMRNLDSSGQAILTDSKNRIYTIALVHEKLYGTPDFSKVDFAKYITELVEMIFHTQHSEGVKLVMECDPVYLSVEKAIPCGLILNELVTNSLKHGFPRPGGGEIRIALRKNSNTVCLEVSDNGIGFPHEFSQEKSGRLGLRLIQLLTTQLHGTIHTKNSPAASCRIEFPA